jgi:hypothetical protein
MLVAARSTLTGEHLAAYAGTCPGLGTHTWRRGQISK